MRFRRTAVGDTAGEIEKRVRILSGVCCTPKYNRTEEGLCVLQSCSRSRSVVNISEYSDKVWGRLFSCRLDIKIPCRRTAVVGCEVANTRGGKHEG